MRSKTDVVKSTRRPRTVLLTVAVCLVAAVAVLGRPALDRVMAAVWPAPVSVLDGEPGPEQVILLLTSTGFEQEEIRLRPGNKVLQIDNRSGLDGLVFTVTRPGQDATLTTNVRRGGRYVENIPFAAGEWAVTENAHPDWTCRIVVEP